MIAARYLGVHYGLICQSCRHDIFSQGYKVLFWQQISIAVFIDNRIYMTESIASVQCGLCYEVNTIFI